MVHHHVNWSWRSLEVVAPYLKSFKNGEQFLVMDIVVEFGGRKGVGVESNGVDILEPGQRLWCLKLKHYNLDRP